VLVIRADWMYNKIEWATEDDREKNFEELDLLPRLEIIRYNLKHFVECVRHGVAPSCDAEDDLNCMRISGSLKKSTETGRAEAC